jgi:hypothetical protein
VSVLFVVGCSNEWENAQEALIVLTSFLYTQKRNFLSAQSSTHAAVIDA